MTKEQEAQQYKAQTETAQKMIRDLRDTLIEWNATGVSGQLGDLVEMIQELEPTFRYSDIYKWL